MKYTNEFYLLLARLNPAIYDAIHPMGPIDFARELTTRETRIASLQTQGSVYGTDSSGEFRLLSKLTWKMNNLREDLRTILVQAKLEGWESNYRNAGALISKIADEYCDTKVRLPHFPPKPHWFDDTITIEEKISAATLINQAAVSVEGTELEAILNQGAERIMNAALAEFTKVRKLELETV